ncbi:hypothetical protein Lal_00016607 [Lupinus albus]|nr:hypothetical protein Lal_00016607 [Lupinus albus]
MTLQISVAMVLHIQGQVVGSRILVHMVAVTLVVENGILVPLVENGIPVVVVEKGKLVVVAEVKCNEPAVVVVGNYIEAVEVEKNRRVVVGETGKMVEGRVWEMEEVVVEVNAGHKLAGVVLHKVVEMVVNN